MIEAKVQPRAHRTLPSLAGSVEGIYRGSLLRTPEAVAVGYFLFTTLQCVFHGVPVSRTVAAAMLPVLICLGANWEAAHSRPWTRLCRGLAPTGLILAAYWQLEWFSAPPLERLERILMTLDEQVFEVGQLRNIVETCGAWGPMLLDSCYLLLYAVPPVCVLALFSARRGDRVEVFLTTLLTGTLLTYALLPHFPSLAPRTAFPQEWLPTIVTPVRRLNLYVLNHLDISTSVFPSGHVAVAFSSAFGMLRALPEVRWAGIGLTVYASLVFLATIYGRYHYAGDGLASLALSFGAWHLSRRSKSNFHGDRLESDN